MVQRLGLGLGCGVGHTVKQEGSMNFAAAVLQVKLGGRLIEDPTNHSRNGNDDGVYLQC